MLLASNLQKQRVLDGKGATTGKIKDVIVKLGPKYPHVTAVMVMSAATNKPVYVPWDKIQTFEESEVTLIGSLPETTHSIIEDDEVLLIKDILDKQIVDTKGKKVIRVQDIKLARIGAKLRVVAVDVSFSGLLRRLGLKFVADWSEARRAPHFIDWANVDIVSRADPSLHLKVSHEKLSLLHPADIADLVNDLSPKQRAALLGSLEMEVAVDTMEEMDTASQAEALTGMESNVASRILEEMAPDDAVDLLADLPESKAKELLGLMHKKDALVLKDLMKHPEYTAGGIMTTEYVSVPTNITVEQAIEIVREQAEEVDEVYYLYLVDPDGKLLGAISLKQLVVAKADRKIEKLVIGEPIYANLETPQEEVARLVAKYNLLAVPVIDEKGVLKGIVTVDDAIDVVIPSAWKRRIPRAFA